VWIWRSEQCKETELRTLLHSRGQLPIQHSLHMLMQSWYRYQQPIRWEGRLLIWQSSIIWVLVFSSERYAILSECSATRWGHAAYWRDPFINAFLYIYYCVLADSLTKCTDRISWYREYCCVAVATMSYTLRTYVGGTTLNPNTAHSKSTLSRFSAWSCVTLTPQGLKLTFLSLQLVSIYLDTTRESYERRKIHSEHRRTTML